MPCCLCPEGTCPPDCPFLEVFPIEAPYKTLQELNETGFNLEFIKECLMKTNTPEEQKTIVRGMVISFEASKTYPLELDEGIFREYEEALARKKKHIENLQKLKAEFQELNQRFKLREAVVVTPAPAAASDDD